MNNRVLSKNIISYLQEKTKKKEKTIRNEISILRRSYGSLPINTVAQIYALQNRTSIITKLTKDEKDSLPNLKIEKPFSVTQNISKAVKSKSIIPFIEYQTNDSFINDHVLETNKTYTYGCYTATFILCRKIIENLLTDIIRKKYPRNVALFFDTARGRRHDFSLILLNLRICSKDFGPDKDLVERIVSKSSPFKDDANYKTHSWYHIVKTKKELEDQHVQDILVMIGQLEKNMSTP